MLREQQMVREFHQRSGNLVAERPSWPGDSVHRVRVSILEEELAEFRNAGESRDLVEVADSLADLLYAIHGAAVEFGIDLEPVFGEVHRSQLSKCDPQPVRRPDGHVLKGPNYSPPRIREALERQLPAPAAV